MAFDKWQNKMNHAADRAKKSVKDEGRRIRDGWNDSAIGKKTNQGYNDIKNYRKYLKDNPDATMGDRAKYIGRGAWNRTKQNTRNTFNKIKNSNTVERAKKTVTNIIERIKKIGHFFSVAWPVFAVVAVAYSVGIIGYSMAQGVEETPHYYCDIGASASVRRTSIYKQYCKQSTSDFYVDNLNGHYLVQDGPGPDTACALGNMMMRYFNSDTRKLVDAPNVFKFLWQSDGLYGVVANTISENDTASTTNIRAVMNNYSDARNTNNATDMTNGSKDFASKHDRGTGYNMSNWGYLRDDNVDYAVWEISSDFYDPQTDNEKWVWDLSLDNKGDGTSWEVPSAISDTSTGTAEDINARIGFSRCRIENKRILVEGNAEEKQKILDIIDKVLNKEDIYEYNKGTAGVVVRYHFMRGGERIYHSVLITKHEGNVWYGIDSAMGTAGGFEGPLNNPNFSPSAYRSYPYYTPESYIANMLNTNSPYTDYTLDQIWYCVGSQYSVPGWLSTR